MTKHIAELATRPNLLLNFSFFAPPSAAELKVLILSC